MRRAGTSGQLTLFAAAADTPTADLLARDHYLGSAGARARCVFTDEHGVLVFAAPTSRRLPADWWELSRWCLVDRCGSQQWATCRRWPVARADRPTTIVSYSDPSAGHTGALYRACGWFWAPTWHSLREPPSGGGLRGGRRHAAKHRWVYLLAPDGRRGEALRLRDESLDRRWPWVGYREPSWKRGRPVIRDADRFRRWIGEADGGRP